VTDEAGLPAPRSRSRSDSGAAPPGDGGSAAELARPILDLELADDALYQLRAAVIAHAIAAGLPQRRADDLVIAIHELAANVIRHAGGRGRLRMWQQNLSVYCEVTDDGGPPGGLAGPCRTSGQATDIQVWPIEPGHGLWLVRQLADQMLLRPGPAGGCATVRFALRSATPTEFQLSGQARHGCMVVAMAGRLDWNSARQLTDAVDDLLAADQAVRLVLDLGGLTSCDAFGLAALLRVAEGVGAHPAADVMLADLPSHLAGPLETAGLTRRFRIADTAESAISQFR